MKNRILFAGSALTMALAAVTAYFVHTHSGKNAILNANLEALTYDESEPGFSYLLQECLFRKENPNSTDRIVRCYKCNEHTLFPIVYDCPKEETILVPAGSSVCVIAY